MLTERTDHLDAIFAALHGQLPAPLVLHGRMSRKQRAALISDLDALPPGAPRILLATGKLIGEGFDHPPLDTLVLAMPVSWKGTLQQYAGRLHREHVTKNVVRIIDFVDMGTRLCFGCGTNASAATGPWVTESPGRRRILSCNPRQPKAPALVERAGRGLLGRASPPLMTPFSNDHLGSRAPLRVK